MKNLKRILQVSLFIILLTSISCSDLDDNEPVDLTSDAIKKNSELFNLLESTVNNGDNPIENTVCMDFIYPLSIFIYNSGLIPENEVVIFNDNQFSGFLAQLTNDQSISISYPLQTTLPDGTVYSVNNNEELKIIVDSCSQEQIISTCNSLFCNIQTPTNQTISVWKVPYIEGQNNDFAGSVFTPTPEGTISFYHLNTTYIGTWIFVFINDQLHLNINLSGISTTAQNWNYNFKVTNLINNSLLLENSTISRTLKKTYSSNQLYTIGQTGPSGGIIAYDKGEFTNGWRYIEVSQQDIIIEEWGCYNSQIPNANSENIGNGYQNSVSIVNFHNNLTNYYTNPTICSNLSNGTVSSKTALNFVIGEYDDWFVPTILELQLLYNNLHTQGIGNFEDTNYWSSTQETISTVKSINFSDGEINTLLKNSTSIKTRPIRYF